jgi:hypothetical protein
VRKEGVRNKRNKSRFDSRSRLEKHTWEAKALSTRPRLHVISVTETRYQEPMKEQKYKPGSKLIIGWRMEMEDGASSKQKSRHKVKQNRDKLEWKLKPGQGTSTLSTIGNVKPSPSYLIIVTPVIILICCQQGKYWRTSSCGPRNAQKQLM